MKNKIAHIYPATSLQQGFIYHALSSPDDDAYRVQVLYDYHYRLDVSKYIQSWERCILEYPILRTAFNWEEEVVQIIYKRGNLEHYYHDLSHLETQMSRDAAIDLLQREDRQRGFDLAVPTLLRLHIIKQGDEHYTVLKSNHHSIADGWSGPVLLSRLHAHYESLERNQVVPLQEDQSYLEAQEYICTHRDSVIKYWKSRLLLVEGSNDVTSLLSRPIDLLNYKQVEESSMVMLKVEGELYDDIKLFSQREGVTINVIVQFLWHKMLQVYTNSAQTIVGTTVSGRDLPIAGIEQSVGLYINTLPLVIDWNNDATILGQLHQVQDRIRDLSTHSFVSLAELQQGGERMFHSLFVYENYPAGKGSVQMRLKMNIRNAVEKVDYPLSILVHEYGALAIQLQYDGKYLEKDKAEHHLGILRNILEQVLKNPNHSHRELSLLTANEYNQTVVRWNVTEKAYEQSKTVYQLFEEQSARTPDSIALVFGEHRLTYEALNSRSNQLARHIRNQYQDRTGRELSADTLIALCVERSAEMIVGMLAILKAGGAYVPIDSSYPQDRIDYLLSDTGSELVLTQGALLAGEGLRLPEGKVICIDFSQELYLHEDDSNLPAYSTAKDLAYVIYTSGTTGTPKGVMIEHRSVCNLVFFQREKLGIDHKVKVLQYAALVFDASVWEIFSALSFGAELYIPSSEVRQDSSLLLNYVERNKIEVATIPPVLLSAMPYKELAHLRTLIVAGESPAPDMMQQWSAGRQLINAYGPTENTVCATMHCYQDGELHTIIGKPLDNMQVYVLDASLHPVPVGVPGELYIGGAGLSRGYLNRKDLTSQRFISNPFAGDWEQEKGYTRLYKTGDLVRWQADGKLDYLGRNDDQVKIRGFRIELGEIEHALLSVAGVRQACVLARERKTEGGNSKYLVAYYVSDVSAGVITQEDMISELSKVLPEYMVPNFFVSMETFPMTINGKLDKHSLPNVEINRIDDYVEPATELEILMSRIWQDALGLDRVGTRDDFFKIGGNSILAIQVSNRMAEALGVDVPVADVFRLKRIEDLLRSIRFMHVPDDNVEKEF